MYYIKYLAWWRPCGFETWCNKNC